jgi:hypothetical protein
MSLFPTSPTVGTLTTMPSGQVFIYTSYGTWRALVSSVTQAPNPPAAPQLGDMWFNTTSDRLFLRADDGGGAGSLWVDIGG